MTANPTLIKTPTPAPVRAPVERTPQKTWRRVAFFTALVLFVLMNVGLLAYRHAYEPGVASILASDPASPIHAREWSWWLARKWLEQKQAPDVVLFGSSQMGSAMAAADAQHDFKVVDALLHREATTFEDELRTNLGGNISVFSLASPGAMCSDAFMASKALFRPQFQPKVVIIGVSPRDFIDNTMPYPAATEPFRFYSRFITPGKLTWCSYNDPMSWLQCLYDTLPCRRLGNFLAETSSRPNPSEHKNLQASAHTPLAAILGGGEAEPNKWLVPANIPANTWVDNTREYKNRFKNPKATVYEAEKKYFDAFLANMQARGIRVLVVGMPSLPMNRALLPAKFWNEFRTSLSTISTLHNAQFLDLTDSPAFVKNDYLDTVHLNAWGGMKLFKILGRYVANDPILYRLLRNQQPAR